MWQQFFDNFGLVVEYWKDFFLKLVGYVTTGIANVFIDLGNFVLDALQPIVNNIVVSAGIDPSVVYSWLPSDLVVAISSLIALGFFCSILLLIKSIFTQWL